MSAEKRFFVAGVQFHELKNIISSLEEGDELELVPDPTNKFDPNAVKIEYEGTQIGFVPKKFSAEIAALLSMETPLVCEITKLNPDAKPWEQCEVSITELEDKVNDLLDEQEDEEERCPECGELLDDCVCIDEE